MAMAEKTHPKHDLPTDDCPEYHCHGVLLLVAAADVTEEIVNHVVEMADCDYGDSPIDWQRLFDDRLDGTQLADNRFVLLGPEYDSPAMRKIQRETRKARR